MPTPARILRMLDDPDIPIPILSPESILDKPSGIKQYVAYMLDRTNTMFEWHNLPDTIPDYMLELYLQIFGYAAFCMVDETNPILVPTRFDQPNGLYIFYGGVGGERDIYYRPRMFTVANPRIKNSIQLTISYPKDSPIPENPCILMPNDRNYNGLLPLFSRYAIEMVENDISVRCAQINARAQIGICAESDREAESARKFFDNLEAGKLGTIADRKLLEGTSVSNIGVQSANPIIQLIELHQYLKASWFNDLGLNVNFNMKREYMSEEEIAVNTDVLLPLIDDMLRCRQEYCEYINQIFGLNISVEKSSAWANKEREETAALAEQESSAGIATEEVDGGIEDEEIIRTADEAAVSGVQSIEPETDGGSDPVAGSGDESEEPSSEQPEPQADAESVDGESPVVSVTINIDTAEEVKVSDDASEPEAPEESEERDSESGDA